MHQEMTIPQARQLIAARLKDDEGFYQGYLSVIAMMLHDRHGITDYYKRNTMARDILQTLFL